MVVIANLTFASNPIRQYRQARQREIQYREDAISPHRAMNIVTICGLQNERFGGISFAAEG